MSLLMSSKRQSNSHVYAEVAEPGPMHTSFMLNAHEWKVEGRVP